MCVMDAQPVTKLVLEIHSSIAPIRGRLHDAAGEARCFTGWLGLAAALEKALRSPDLRSWKKTG